MNIFLPAVAELMCCTNQAVLDQGYLPSQVVSANALYRHCNMFNISHIIDIP
jgi:hypothetical protein